MIGLYAHVSSPVVKGNGYLFTIQKFDSYSHNISAIGGFWDASIGIAVNQSNAEDWYEKGLGRQVHVKNHLGGTVWRGFVNEISIAAGSQTLSRGPLFDIGNRVGAVYTPRDFSQYPPEDGTTTYTELDNDTPSQSSYGIFEKWAAAGTTTLENAEKIRQVFMEANKLPKTTGDFSISGTGQALSITLNLLGNIHWLEVYPYNNFTPNVITAYDKLLQVINANATINPGVWSTDYNNIVDNSFTMEQLEDKNRYAWDIVNEILSLGNDTNDLRRVLGLYEDDKFFYNVIPSTIDYEYRLSNQHQMIKDYKSGVLVYPWDVRPGKWIRTSDWLIGRIVDSNDLSGDPRNKFIESISFSAPYTVGITGSPFDTLSQILAKITYTGGQY